MTSNVEQAIPKATTIRQRPPKQRITRRHGRNRQGKHRDCVDHPKRDDRQDNRAQPDANAPQLLEHSDLDQVIEAKRQHGTARSRRPDGRQATSLIGTFVAREQPMPRTGAENQTRKVSDRRGRDERRLRVIKGQLESVSLRATRSDAATLTSADATPTIRRRRGTGARLDGLDSELMRIEGGSLASRCARDTRHLSNSVAMNAEQRSGTARLREYPTDQSHPSGAVFRVGERGSSNTCADWRRMNPQFAHVSGNASVPRSTEPLATTCSSAIRSSHPCHCSCPQNGQAIRASRLRRKSKIPFIANGASAHVLRCASCASWLRRTHRRDSLFVDFDHMAPGVGTARETLEALRASRDDRVRAGAGFDGVPLFELLVEERVESVGARTEWIHLVR